MTARLLAVAAIALSTLAALSLTCPAAWAQETTMLETTAGAAGKVSQQEMGEEALLKLEAQREEIEMLEDEHADAYDAASESFAGSAG